MSNNNEITMALARLKHNLGSGASNGWIAMVANHCMEIGHRWGGPEVLAWWLAERTKPIPVTRNKRAREYQMGLKRRHRGGWTRMQVTQYLSLRSAEAYPGRYGRVVG